MPTTLAISRAKSIRTPFQKTTKQNNNKKNWVDFNASDNQALKKWEI